MAVVVVVRELVEVRELVVQESAAQVSAAPLPQCSVVKSPVVSELGRRAMSPNLHWR